MLDISRYKKEKSLEIYRLLENREAIYLDLNYWIKLREESKKVHADERKLLDKVIALSQSKRCIFPISEITFSEIMKQGDLSTRKETVELVDRLSEGICFMPMKERIQLETRVWFLQMTGKLAYSKEELIWTRFAFGLFDFVVYSLPSFMLHRGFLDTLCRKLLWDFVENKSWTFTYKDKVDKFNDNFRKYAHENMTNKDTYLSELGGFIDVYAEAIKDVMAAEFYREYGQYPTIEERAQDKLPQVIYNGFKYGKITTELPIFDIIPRLYAWCRWIGKEFKDGNDTLDFYHASFALPYCSYFFTERRLSAGIKECELDKKYNCKVIYKYSDVLDAVTALEQPNS